MTNKILGRLPSKQFKYDHQNNSSDVGVGTSSNVVLYNYGNKFPLASVFSNGSLKYFSKNYEPMPFFRDVPNSDIKVSHTSAQAE